MESATPPAGADAFWTESETTGSTPAEVEERQPRHCSVIQGPCTGCFVKRERESHKGALGGGEGGGLGNAWVILSATPP